MISANISVLQSAGTSSLWVAQVTAETAGGRRGVAPSQTSAHMTQLIMPQYANTLGITFGGQVRPLYALFEADNGWDGKDRN